MREEQLAHIEEWLKGYERDRERLGIHPSVDMETAVLYIWTTELGLGVLESVGIEPKSAKAWADIQNRLARSLQLPPDDGERMPRQAVWMRAFGRLPDDPRQHRAALAYASDYSILEPVLRAHGVAWAEPGLKVASLDHAMWWHRDARVDEWLLFTMESPSASGGRGLSLGRIYTRDGMLVASVAQEGMVRLPAL